MSDCASNAFDAGQFLRDFASKCAEELGDTALQNGVPVKIMGAVENAGGIALGTIVDFVFDKNMGVTNECY